MGAGKSTRFLKSFPCATVAGGRVAASPLSEWKVWSTRSLFRALINFQVSFSRFPEARPLKNLFN